MYSPGTHEKQGGIKRKHGVSFDDATRVFEDPYHLITQDREVDGEQRWQAIGRVGSVRILFVACTIFDEQEGEMTRIISARRAEKEEIIRYVENC